ncbi:MAG: hypothetical protein K0S28_967 [Paucimonas sp.]|jgi:hypothetical protein|nr:hypothetical protein [Paucimonas sp.]
MHLIQILLPLYDNEGNRFDRDRYEEISSELVNRFGGLTAYTRAPAAGLWREEGEAVHDDVVIYEVMADNLDEAWWRAYRIMLEKRFRQQSLIVRATTIRQL